MSHHTLRVRRSRRLATLADRATTADREGFSRGPYPGLSRWDLGVSACVLKESCRSIRTKVGGVPLQPEHPDLRLAVQRRTQTYPPHVHPCTHTHTQTILKFRLSTINVLEQCVWQSLPTQHVVSHQHHMWCPTTFF